VSRSSTLEDETDPVSETLCFLVIYNSGRWTKSINLVILSVLHDRQKTFNSAYWMYV
jgi:hypothetical protein